MNLTWIKELWPVLVAGVGLVGFAYVMDYRLATVEHTLKDTDIKELSRRLGAIEGELRDVDLKQMSRQAAALKCEVKNIKKVLKQQPEIDCD